MDNAQWHVFLLNILEHFMCTQIRMDFMDDGHHGFSGTFILNKNGITTWY